MDMQCQITFRAVVGHRSGSIRENFQDVIRDYRTLSSEYTPRMRAVLHKGKLGSIQLFMDDHPLLEVPWNDVREWHRTVKFLGIDHPQAQLRLFLTYARSFYERLPPEPLEPDTVFA